MVKIFTERSVNGSVVNIRNKNIKNKKEGIVGVQQFRSEIMKAFCFKIHYY
jgi:hypothetical protein